MVNNFWYNQGMSLDSTDFTVTYVKLQGKLF